MGMSTDAATSPQVVAAFQGVVGVALHPESQPTAQRLVNAVMSICSLAGYDSVDREVAFGLLADHPDIPVTYDDLYNTWLHSP